MRPRDGLGKQRPGPRGKPCQNAWWAVPVEPDDRALVLRAQAGDQDAFGVLVRRHQRTVFGFCYRMVQSEDLAADLTQEVFVRAWRYLARFEADRPLRPWLLRIAANRTATRQTHDQARQTAALDELTVEPAAPDDTTRSSERQELQQAVRRALLELSPQQRQAVVLVELEGCTAPEAGLQMGCTAATVRQHVFRAKRRLRKLLAGYVGAAELEPSEAEEP